MNKKFISFIDFTNLNDEDKYKLLILRENKIDKAIEYIEKEKYVSADENCEIIAGYHIDELLDILKGDK